VKTIDLSKGFLDNKALDDSRTAPLSAWQHKRYRELVPLVGDFHAAPVLVRGALDVAKAVAVLPTGFPRDGQAIRRRAASGGFRGRAFNRAVEGVFYHDVQDFAAVLYVQQNLPVLARPSSLRPGRCPEGCRGLR